MDSPSLPPIEPQIARARTLPAAAYTDARLFDRERLAVFARHFQPVAGLSQLTHPGDQLACQVAGYPILILRDGDGTLRAFHDVCRHRAGPLSDGSGQGPGQVCRRQTLQCRYHGWTYALDGRLLHTPGLRSHDDPPETGRAAEGFARADFSLHPVEVASFGPLVFVRLQRPPDPAPSLLDHLGELPAEVARFGAAPLQLGERREYLVECNWKVYIDNYLEGYHIPLVHPGLMRELDYPRYRVETRTWHSRQHAPIRPLPAAAGSAADSARGREYVPGDGAAEAAYYWVFPNLMLNYYPDHLQVNIVRPLTVNQTAVIFEWYFPAAAGAGVPPTPSEQATQARRVAFADTVQAEDAAICRAVQERLQAGIYDSGRFVPGYEDGVHHFQSLLTRTLGL
jgi:choline monooxygenase